MSNRLTPVVMPQMGESLAEGTLVKWLKAPGDRVAQDEPLFEISTDKVDTEVPAPIAGVLREIIVKEGETVAVNEPVAMIEPFAERAAVPAAAPEASASPAEAAAAHFKTTHAPVLVNFRRQPEPASEARTRSAPAQSPAAPEGSGQRPPVARQSAGSTRPSSPLGPRAYSPGVLKAAWEGNVPLGTLTTLAGSGRNGRLTKKDIENYLARQAKPADAGDAGVDAPRPRAVASDPNPLPLEHAPHSSARASAVDVPPEYLYQPGPDDRIVPMTPIRRRIAQHMTWSARISPQATAFGECDMSLAAAAIDRRREQDRDAPLTYTALVAYATVAALRDFPVLNASVVKDAIVLKPKVNLGIAVAVQDDELVVPVVKAADELSLDGLARAIHDLAIRARERRLKAADVQGGTFTLTNPGIFGGLGGAPILNQPQVAILGLGSITKRAVVIGDAIAIRPMMMTSLTFDHRATDGMTAFRYLEALRRILEAGAWQ